jgi:hypothetical protein
MQRTDKMELVKHLEAQNAKTQKWMDENPGSWGGMIVTDPAHWAKYGVYTVEDYQRYQKIRYISDAYKDAYGFRPRGYDWDNMSMDELKAWSEDLSHKG